MKNKGIVVFIVVAIALGIAAIVHKQNCEDMALRFFGSPFLTSLEMHRSYCKVWR